MRTLKLTHEQIELIQQALGIAEKKLIDIHATILNDTILVRGVNGPTQKSKENSLCLEKSIEFSDLNMAISNSELDV